MELAVIPSRSLLFLRAVVNIIFGGLILTYPGLTLAIVAIAFAINLLIIGLFMIFEPAFDHENKHTTLTVVLGLIGAIAGVYLVSNPLISISIISWLIAIWALLFGIVDLYIGISSSKYGVGGGWVFMLLGVFSVLFGTFLIFNPLEGSLALVWIIGLYALIVGIIYGFKGLTYHQLIGKKSSKSRK